MNKTILITGASSGIGLAAAALFFGNVRNVVAMMRNPGFFQRNERSREPAP
jgi:NAD(P)-dependent dehydrogenase (short-subunit alcohol dehydrogenase family)